MKKCIRLIRVDNGDSNVIKSRPRPKGSYIQCTTSINDFLNILTNVKIDDEFDILEHDLKKNVRFGVQNDITTILTPFESQTSTIGRIKIVKIVDNFGSRVRYEWE